MPFDLGVTARLTAECRDPGGTLTDATTVTVAGATTGGLYSAAVVLSGARRGPVDRD